MKLINKILLLLLLTLTYVACDKEFEDDLVKDNKPEIPVTFDGATTAAFNPYYNVSRAGSFSITLTIPETSRLKIKELTKVIGGATGINAGNLTDTKVNSYLAAPIAVDGTSVVFTTTIEEFNKKVDAAALVPDELTVPPVVERAFMFLLTMEDDSKIIPVQCRIRITTEKVITFDDDAAKKGGNYIVSGIVKIKASVGADVTSVNVYSRYTTQGSTVSKTYSLGTFPVSNGAIDFSAPAKNLFDPADLQDNLNATAAGKIKAIGAVTLLFEAVSTDGAKQNAFVATLINSLSVTSFSAKAVKTNPVTFYNDSTIYVKFTAANPGTARLSKVEVFRKINTNAEETTPVVTKTYASTAANVTDSLAVVIPSLPNLPKDKDVTYRVVMTSAIGKIDERTYKVTNVGIVPLAKVRTINLWNPAALTGTRTEDWSFIKHKAVTDNNTDITDIKLQLTGDTFGLVRGTTNSSEYVLLPPTFDYAKADYNTIKTAYDAGTKVPSLSGLVFGDIFIIKVGTAPNNGNQLKLVKVTGLTLDRTADQDVLVLEYKSAD